MGNSAGGQVSGASPRLYRRACDMLAAEITSGTLASGLRLTETGVADRFGISRAPARQALAELESRGLIAKSSARGYVVTHAGALSPPEPAADPPPATDPGERLHFLPSWEPIYRQAEIDIVSRTSLASWRINEAGLAKAHGVSRTVAREVMARLQQRGIVHKDDAGRWHAPALTATYIGELYELRWVLEPLALEKSYPLLPPDLLPRLLNDLRKAIDAGNGASGNLLDSIEHQLHSELLGHCGNRALMQAISLPQSILVAHHFLYQPAKAPAGEEPFLEEHLAVFERLAEGRLTEACEALARHLQISRERAIGRIRAIARDLSLRDLPYLERLENVRIDP